MWLLWVDFLIVHFQFLYWIYYLIILDIIYSCSLTDHLFASTFHIFRIRLWLFLEKFQLLHDFWGDLTSLSIVLISPARSLLIVHGWQLTLWLQLLRLLIDCITSLFRDISYNNFLSFNTCFWEIEW